MNTGPILLVWRTKSVTCSNSIQFCKKRTDPFKLMPLDATRKSTDSVWLLTTAILQFASFESGPIILAPSASRFNTSTSPKGQSIRSNSINQHHFPIYRRRINQFPQPVNPNHLWKTQWKGTKTSQIWVREWQQCGQINGSFMKHWRIWARKCWILLKHWQNKKAPPA